MKTLKKALKFLVATVAIALLIIVVFAAQLFNDRKAALEFAVAILTDYRLSIDGPFSFGTEGGVGSVSLGDAVLSTSSDNTPLLIVGRLELVADFSDFSMTSANIQKLRVEDIVATVIRSDDESLNWPALFEQRPDEVSAERDWDIVLGEINLKNVLIDFEGFADRPQQLQIHSLALSENLKPRVIEANGNLNDLPIKVYGELYDLSAFVLDQQPLRLSLHTTVDTFQAHLVGVFSNSDATTDIRLQVDADNMEVLTGVFSDDLPNIGELSLSAQLLNQEDDYQLRDIDVVVDGPDLNLAMTGRIESLLGDPALALTVSLASPDVGRFDILNNQLGNDLSGLQFKMAGHISYQERQAKFADLTLSANDQQQSMAISAENLRAELLENSTVIHAENSVLTYRVKDENKTIDKPWEYQYQAENIFTEIKSGANKGLSAVVKTNGEYKGLLTSVDGVWGEDGNYQFDVILDQAVAKIDGLLKQDRFQIVGRLVTPSLKPLGTLLDETVLPITHGEIVIAVDMKGEDWMLSQLDLSLVNKASSITVVGHANDLLNFDDYQLSVGVKAASLKQLEQWVSEHSELVELSLDAFGDTRTYASAGDVKYRRAQTGASPWLQDVMTLLALDQWVEEYPALNGKTAIDLALQGQGENLTIDIDTVKLRSELASVDWSGVVLDKEALSSINGSLQADLKVGAVDDVATSVSIKTATMKKNEGPLVLSAMDVVAGDSRFTGDLELSIDGGLKQVAGQLDFKVLDIKPYTSEIEMEDKTAAAGSEETSAKVEPFFSAEKYSLEWLPEYDIDLAVSAEEFLTPWFDARLLKMEVLSTAGLFKVTPIEFMLSEADITGEFAFDSAQPEPSVKLKLLARNLDIDLVSVLRDYNVMKSGTVHLLVDVEAFGATEKALAASLDGQTTVFTLNSVLNGRDLSDISPEVLTEVNQRVNPFYTKPKEGEDTSLECGVIHFEIQKGIMTADKSIILVTPAIVFGANGAIDLSQETLRMQIIPRVRKGLGLSFRGSVAKMAVINGPMTAPEVEFDPRGAITSAGRDVAGTVLYGPIYWLYLGQAQKLLASSNACPKLIEKLKADYNN